jgi:hypothetical protein
MALVRHGGLGRGLAGAVRPLGCVLVGGTAALLLLGVAPSGVPGWAAPSAAIGAKLLPLYLVAALGIAVGRLVQLDRATVGTVLVRAVSPVVFFGAVAMAPVSPADLGFIAVFFLLPAAICLAVRGVVQPVLGPAEARLSAFLAGSANVGYFGVPAAMAVLPPAALGAYMLSLLGLAVYENTVGYYMMARGGATVRTGCAACSACRRRMPSRSASRRTGPAHAARPSCTQSGRRSGAATWCSACWRSASGWRGWAGAGDGALRAATALVRLLAWPAAAAALIVLDGLAGSSLGPQLRPRRAALRRAALRDERGDLRGRARPGAGEGGGLRAGDDAAGTAGGAVARAGAARARAAAAGVRRRALLLS